MKKLKNLRIRLVHLAIAGIAFVPVFSSCSPEDEPTPADARDVFVANWTVNEHSTQIGNSTFTVSIAKSTTNTAQVLIDNFYNVGAGNKATADISGSAVTINTQTFSSQQLHGSGTKTGANSINLTYYMNNGSVIDTCTATLTRQ
ncbi:MAG TPA: hypothetical protein VL651_01325 [Bacteroidia bacterium]|jgi:hypothetical protein|nr:hypothetical protein [Bacteroidia bacterium]